ncbi:hypothetical protein [Leptolyngbya sp. NIES-2104]|uniref:hypothetical protein n=1 Tax=Leptolyngbya sp. NIES-2104 TaxID=1552121 RepID=UPI0006ECB47B|nr:hypothetical protein [Leptolyngbya sp. NIES-2104]GAP98267.1 hypothetical protein NIES2104_48210 [Leptolyngbya sp. NIES-2104]
MDQLAPSEQQLLEKIRQLPQEKVVEIEHFIDGLMKQNQSVQQRIAWNEAIAQMSTDSEIEAEIASINAEFAITELDGLGHP